MGRLKFVSLILVAACVCLILYVAKSNATLSKKRSTKKDRNAPRPPGVAYNNKKYPSKCHVCRLMVEEINKSMSGDGAKKELTEEELREKKRRDRRKSKADKKREKALPILTAIEDVCNTMLNYVPQEEDKKKFRYIKSDVLKDTKTLVESQIKGDAESEQMKTEYERFRHPETNRLMEMCDEIINKRENELIKWNSMEESPDLFDYLCRDRLFVTGEEVSDSCLQQETIKNDLWTNAFDVILEKHPELKNQEF